MILRKYLINYYYLKVPSTEKNYLMKWKTLICKTILQFQQI